MFNISRFLRVWQSLVSKLNCLRPLSLVLQCVPYYWRVKGCCSRPLGKFADSSMMNKLCGGNISSCYDESVISGRYQRIFELSNVL